DMAAVAMSAFTGQPRTAAFITWLLGVGDLLLERTADRARTAISTLMRLEVTDAWRVTGDKVEHVPSTALRAGDTLVLDPGQRVPADGLVLAGIASVD